MRKSFLLLLTLIVSIAVMAGPVTPDEARRNVSKFMNPRRAAAVIQNPEALRLVHTSHYKVQDNMLAPSYYVFNVGQNEGYIIAAADDRIPAVLGYSDCGAIDLDNMPEPTSMTISSKLSSIRTNMMDQASSALKRG